VVLEKEDLRFAKGRASFSKTKGFFLHFRLSACQWARNVYAPLCANSQVCFAAVSIHFRESGRQNSRRRALEISEFCAKSFGQREKWRGKICRNGEKILNLYAETKRQMFDLWKSL